MAHRSKRKHVKHMHEHQQLEEHEEQAGGMRARAASFVELGRALVARVMERPRAFKERLLRRPRELAEKLSGLYAGLRPTAK
jgi:hypothetical protein